MANFHINPQTGDPGVCSAQIRCRYGAESQHFDSVDLARSAYERKMESLGVSIDNLYSRLDNLVPFESSNFNAIEFRATWIKDWPTEWSPEAKENLYNVTKMQEILTKSNMTSKDWAEVKEINNHLHQEGPADPNNIGHQGLINQINALGQELMIQREAHDYPYATGPSRPEMQGLDGLNDAQDEVFRAYNRDLGTNDYVFGSTVEGWSDRTLDRIVGGEVYKLDNDTPEGHFVSLIPERDRLMSALSNPESPNFHSRMYLATVFPEKELRSVMDREGVRDITVDTFKYNGNERGLSYSTVGSDGTTRRFNVSEDSDSIKIVAEKPGNDSATPFELKVPKDERYQAAEALVFFMKEAQNDENKNGRQAYDSADHREWKAKFDNSDIGY